MAWGSRMIGWHDGTVNQGMSFLEVSWFLGGSLKEGLYASSGW